MTPCLKGDTSSKPSFLVSMLVFGGVNPATVGSNDSLESIWNPSNHLEKTVAKSQRNLRCPEETPKIIISDNVTLCVFGYEGEKRKSKKKDLLLMEEIRLTTWDV